MIWYDMSYNQLDTDFLDKLEFNNELKENKEEEVIDEPDQTNSFIFNCYRCIL